jgi:putative colanic acid biosynthesis acetyltransferase WcaF
MNSRPKGLDNRASQSAMRIPAILDASQSKPREGGPSFSFSTRLLRLAWNLCWAVTCSWGPVGGPFDRWRNGWLRLFGARVHPTARVYGTARIWWPANLMLEEHATIGDGAIIYSMGEIRVEPYAVISQRAHICAGSHDLESEHFQLIARPVRIGAWAWIAAESFVAPGVEVGEGAVLGARGAAFAPLDPWTIYRGNPAQRVRDRRRFAPAPSTGAVIDQRR